jgi:diguanylate cyclase (GGDEF)-like protein/PAS domain S-box-containing protein
MRIRLFSPKRISTKLLLVLLPLLIAFSLIISIVGPREHEKQALAAVADKAESIARIAAHSLGPALYRNDNDAINGVIQDIRPNRSVISILVANEIGQVIASYNKNQPALKNPDENQLTGISADGKKRTTTLPIFYRGRKVGQLYLGLSLEEALQNVEDARKKLILISSLIFLVGLLAIFGTSRLITRPLGRVAETARQIACGDLTKRAIVVGEDEVGKLGLAFNTMIDHLWEAQTLLGKKVEERTGELQTEIRERKKAEEALREREEFIRNMVESLSEGICIADTSETFTFANPASDKIFGVEKGGLVGLTLRDFTTPDQFAVILEQTRKRQEGGRSAYEFRICRPNGEERTLFVAAIPRFDKLGAYAGSLGVFSDITERKSSEQSVREANNRLQLSILALEQRNKEMFLLSELYDRCQMCQKETEIYDFINAYAGQLFPEESGALYIYKASRNLLEAVASWGESPPQRKTMSPEDCWSLRRNKSYNLDELKSGPLCPHVEDEGRPFSPYICLPLNTSEEPLGLLHIQLNRPGDEEGDENIVPDNRHIKKLRKQLAANFGERIAMALSNLRLSEKLRQQSIRDPLTGLFNRRFMEETLTRELSKAARNGESLGIIMLDIDHFKQFNDNHGHKAGDMMLKSVGQFLQTSVRKEDVVCRYGGEEFVIILPGASLGIAKKRAVDLSWKSRLLKIDYDQKILGPITFSMGIAIFPRDADTAAGILQVSDAALFQAKKAGRNQIISNGGHKR